MMYTDLGTECETWFYWSHTAVGEGCLKLRCSVLTLEDAEQEGEIYTSCP